MWPEIGSRHVYPVIYLAAIPVHCLITFLWAGRFLCLPAAVPRVVALCYLWGMTLGARGYAELTAGHLSLTSFLSQNKLKVPRWLGADRLYTWS